MIDKTFSNHCFFPDMEQKRAQLSVGNSSEVSLKVTESDLSSLTSTIKNPSGLEHPCVLKRLPNGHLGKKVCFSF